MTAFSLLFCCCFCPSVWHAARPSKSCGRYMSTTRSSTAMQKRNSPVRSVRRSFTPWLMSGSTWSVSGSESQPSWLVTLFPFVTLGFLFYIPTDCCAGFCFGCCFPLSLFCEISILFPRKSLPHSLCVVKEVFVQKTSCHWDLFILAT